MIKLPHIENLKEFLDASPTSFQAAEQIEKHLIKNGFKRLDETVEWKLAPGKKYYVSRNQSAVIAFITGKQHANLTGFRIAASHLDSPCLKIKPDAVKAERNNLKLGVEVYGGPIISTWLDRELSLAGRIMVRTADTNSKSKGKWESRLFNLKKPLAIIPNAAIHLNRDVNKGFEYNAQTQLPAVIRAAEKGSKSLTLKDILAGYMNLKAEQIGEFDLFLYDPNPAARIGVEEELLVSGRLDNLGMTHAILSAINEAKASESVAMAVFYDNEEIGSTTPQGANSSFAADILQRICLAQKLNQEQAMIAFRKSFLVSADMAHAVHPNFADKHDPAYMPLINHGPVIKMNATQRYATTSESCTWFESACERAKVPVQKVINRSDMASGSTVGPISAAKLGISTVDIGNPMWAMHSIRETMGVADHEYLIKALIEFYKE